MKEHSEHKHVNVLIEHLCASLQAHAKVQTKEWFENYLKGAISYRGLKTPVVTKILTEWNKEHAVTSYPLSVQRQLVKSLMSRSFAEDKFAATIYLQKYLSSALSPKEILTDAQIMFHNEYFYDWSTTDWFTVRVISTALKNSEKLGAETMLEWSKSMNLWQRRASIVAFRKVVEEPRYHSYIESIIHTLVVENERFIQTGVGWVLSDLSKSHPETAHALFTRHLSLLDKEVITRHTKYLPRARDLIKAKKRLTSKV